MSHSCVCVCVCAGVWHLIRWLHLTVVLSQRSALTPLLTSCLKVFLVLLFNLHCFDLVHTQHSLIHLNKTPFPLLPASQAAQIHGFILLTWIDCLCLSRSWYDHWKSFTKWKSLLSLFLSLSSKCMMIFLWSLFFHLQADFRGNQQGDNSWAGDYMRCVWAYAL